MGLIRKKVPPQSTRFEAMKSAFLEGLDVYIRRRTSPVLLEFRQAVEADLNSFLLGQAKNSYQFSLSVQQGGIVEYVSVNFEETVIEVSCGGCTSVQATGMDSYTNWSYSLWRDGTENNAGVYAESFDIIRELFASDRVHFSIDTPDHFCYYPDEIEVAEETNSLSARIEEYYSTHVIPIPTLWDMTPDYHGRVVEVTGLLDYAFKEDGWCKLYAAHYRRPSITDYVEITIELKEPIPDYLWQRPRIFRTPVTFTGTFIYDPEDRTYGLIDARYSEYWMNEHGQIECKGLNCEHDCTEGCPVHCNNVANMLLGQANYQDAKDLVHVSLEKVPLYAENWIVLAECYMATTKYEEAEEAYYKAYNIDKTNPRLLSGLIEVSIRLGRIANAKRYSIMLSKCSGNSIDNPVTDIMGKLMDDEMYRPQIYLPDRVWDAIRNESEDAFESLVFEQKLLELMFEESTVPISGFREACYRICSGSITKMREALEKERIPDAETMCIHDLLVAYEKNFIQY